MQDDQSQLSEGLAIQVDGETGAARVRRYRLGDEDALVEMYRSIFPEESRTVDDWWWCFQQAPEGPADIRVLESDGHVVGAITHVPVAVWIEGRRHCLAIGCDLMVRPEFRGQGGSRQLVSAFLASDDFSRSSSTMLGSLFCSASGWGNANTLKSFPRTI